MRIVSIVFFIVLASVVCHAEEVIFSTGEYPPFSSKSLPNYGFTTELVTAICKEAGITPIYKFYPWKRAETTLISGESFGAFPFYVSKERKQKFNFSDTLHYQENVFLYYVGNNKITDKVKKSKSLDELKNMTFGMVIGSDLHRKDYEDRGIDYRAVPEYNQLIKMLKTNRIDLVLEGKTALYYEIRKSDPEDIDKFQEFPYKQEHKKQIAVMVSRKYPNSKQILKRFNEAFSRIRRNGVYDKIIEKNKLSSAY